MSNEQLVILIKAGEDVAQNMELLYSQVKRFIHSITWSYRGAGASFGLGAEGHLSASSCCQSRGSLCFTRMAILLSLGV